MLFGYESLQNDFKKLIADGRLSHAYLFYGEPEIGKFLFAQELASQLAEPGDVLTVDFSADKETSAESVGIERVRELEHFLHHTPTGAHRVAIIRDAHWLTDQAQNALLKVLEEPPRSGIILATVADPSIFLPAVRSRFQHIFMPVASSKQILDFLSSYDIIDTQKRLLVERSYGRIGRAKKLAEEASPAHIQAERLSHAALRAPSPMEKKKLSDAILEFFDEDAGNSGAFIEALTDALRGDAKNVPALHALCEFAQNMETMSVQKRIHVKKVLWRIEPR